MTSSDKYSLVEQSRPENFGENEIRITADGRIRSYIAYAVSRLENNKTDEIVLKAMSQAISKAVQVAEIIKRRVVGIHQETNIESADIKERWIPKEDGLDVRETSRQVSSISIKLSTKELDKDSIGYQEPLPAEEVRDRNAPRFNNNRRQNRRRDDDDDDEDDDRPKRQNRRRDDDDGNRRQGGNRRRDDDYGGNRRQGGNRRRDDDDYGRRQGGNRGRDDDYGGGNRRRDDDDDGNRRQGGNRGRDDDYGGGNRRQGGNRGGQNRRRDDDYGGNRRGGNRGGQNRRRNNNYYY